MEIASLPERIAARIVYVEETGCEIFTGYCTKDGYPQAKYGGKAVLVHRLRYTLEVRELGPDETLDHLKDDRGPCRFRNCTCPAHLEPVTRSENSRRVVTANSLKTHCPRGHEYAVHGYLSTHNKDGRTRRHCRLCQRKGGRSGVIA